MTIHAIGNGLYEWQMRAALAGGRDMTARTLRTSLGETLRDVASAPDQRPASAPTIEPNAISPS